MVRPHMFGYNEQTAASNAFQRNASQPVHDKAIVEFDTLVQSLRDSGIQVLVSQDPGTPLTPDSLFPNNWISTHQDGTVFLYPMEAPVRRDERRPEVLNLLRETFAVASVQDLTAFEHQGVFLEGTGSMVLDRVNRIAYACISTRTDASVLAEFGRRAAYKVLPFHASDASGLPIYHTNVMMSIATGLAVICAEAIADKAERDMVLNSLHAGGLEVVTISMEQVLHFAGNMLALHNNNHEQILVMSEQALSSLSQAQVSALQKHARILSSPIYNIEYTGGGSVRCMLAEVFLPEKK